MFYLIISQLRVKKRNFTSRKLRYPFAFKLLTFDIFYFWYNNYYKLIKFYLKLPASIVFVYFWLGLYLNFYFIYYYEESHLWISYTQTPEFLREHMILYRWYNVVYTNSFLCHIFFLVVSSKPELLLISLIFTLISVTIFYLSKVPPVIKNNCIDFSTVRFILNLLPSFIFFWNNFILFNRFIRVTQTKLIGEKYYYIKYDLYPWDEYPCPYGLVMEEKSKYRIANLCLN